MNPDDITSGDKRFLAKAITLVESKTPSDQKRAQQLLASLPPRTNKSLRLGISGPPGVGKSTFIDSFGLLLLEKGKKLAALTIDPSSPISGGSLLGDKTRMAELAQKNETFIRPSPTGGVLGGIAPHTQESILLCEAAGYDVVLIESVGVGQSEHQLALLVDFFILLTLPNSGDELQGIKKGIFELADLVAVNKNDGNHRADASKTLAVTKSALGSFQPRSFWHPKALACSALTKSGLEEIWQTIEDYCCQAKENGQWDARRLRQSNSWLEQAIHRALDEYVKNTPQVASLRKTLEQDVAKGKKSTLEAGREFVERLFK